MAESLIPKGFYRIAESEMLNGTTVAYFNRERNKLLFKVNGSLVGPIDPPSLDSFFNVMKDVGSMRGNYRAI